MDADLPALWSWEGGATLVAPLVAIGAALVTKRVVPSLAAAVLVGAFVAVQGDPLAAPVRLLQVIRDVVFDLDNLKVSAFCTLVAAAVGVMAASGGIRAMVSLVEPIASSTTTRAASWWATALLRCAIGTG